jgi:PAS domain S-box-containing protein
LLAAKHGYRGCWSFPMMTTAGSVVGSFALYFAEPRSPSKRERDLANELARTAAILVSRDQESRQRLRIETALKESEERVRMALDAGLMGTWRSDLATGLQQWSEQEFKLFGLSPGQVVSSRDLFLSLVHPDDRRLVEYGPQDLKPGRGLLDSEFRIVRPDGEVRWLVAHTVVRHAADGRPTDMIGLNWDITDAKNANSALRESEARFRQFAKASSGALWIRKAGTLAMEYVSPAIARIYGVQLDDFLGDLKHWAAVIVPDDRASALEHIEKARKGEATVHEFRIQRCDDRAFRWIRNTAFPLFDELGHVHRIGGIFEDVTEEKLAVEHQSVLLAELQHRVRNIMAITRSITVRTGERAESVREYKDLMVGRLLALARVQVLLTRAANANVSVRTIVQDEVSAQAQHESQYILDGPDVALSPKAAEVLTLAVHELASNAVKYGALSVSKGRVTVRWRKVEKQGTAWLRLDWEEEDGPPIKAPAKPGRGFGRELIEGRIPYELRGTGKIVIKPTGAECHIELPLMAGASLLETGAPQRATVFGGSLDMTGEQSLSRRRILVVEDEYFLATDIARALQGAGAEVLGPSPTEEAARAALGLGRPDAVVVDINLGQGPSFKLAEDLKEEGIPFLFVTGYDRGAIPEEFDDVERLEKPVQLRRVIGAIAKLLDEPSVTPNRPYRS